jgi:hypothetical protein
MERNNLINHVSSTSPEASPPPDQSAPQAPPKRRFGKQLVVAVAALAVIALIAAALFIPQGAAIIPLTVNYEVGEKMVYDTGYAMTFDLGNTPLPSGFTMLPLNSTSVNSTSSIEVIAFDGEFYTLNNTATIVLNQKPSSYSYISMMNKTGFSTYVLNLGSQGTQQVTTNTSLGNPYLAELLNRPEVKVGDTWQVKLPFSNSSSMQTTGELTVTFGGFEDLTVPAGTFRVFRVDIASHNLSMRNNIPGNNSGLNVAMNMDGKMYTEYGTMRQIKSTMQGTVTYESAEMNYSMNISMDMTMVQLLKP